uniref:Uncharacterized protein n=1 Tax=Arundo donax TaxID=35708 RepID=A0A0A8YPC1_ARUDO
MITVFYKNSMIYCSHAVSFATLWFELI